MADAVICEPLRTPVGGFGGALRDVAAQELAATVIRELVRRTGITADQVEDVVFGHCYPTMDAPAIGRVAALDAGLEVTVPGIQVDRRCGSGLQAVLYAAMAVQTGARRWCSPAARSRCRARRTTARRRAGAPRRAASR